MAAGDHEDGLIVILDSNTGELTSSRKNNEPIGNAENDFIAGFCDNPDDPGSFDIVGTTEGVIPEA